MTRSKQPGDGPGLRTAGPAGTGRSGNGRGAGTGGPRRSGRGFGPSGRWAMLTPVGSDISRQVANVATDVLAENEFQIAESPAATSEDLLRVCDDVAGSVDLHIVLARLSAGRGGDSSEVMRQIVEDPLPGVSELVRSIQYTSGYSRAIFEYCTAGWVGSTLALVLPADVGAVYDSLSELVPVVVEVLDGSAGGGDFVLPEFAEDPIPLPTKDERKSDGATILKMPKPGRGPRGDDA